MIVVTGGAGFIGSVIIGYLNKKGITDIVVYDDLPEETQFLNLNNKQFLKLYSSNSYPQLKNVEAVIHFGAISNTLEKNWAKIYQKNIESTRQWNNLCKQHNIPLIFASSAAVYGNGNGPLNQYAFSKKIIEKELTNACILRLFNIYGPNEYHKDRMASTVYHWHNQHQQNNKISIFQGSNTFFRDFVYVEDVAKVVLYFIKNYIPGIYDVGTGNAISFQTLADEFTKSVQNCKLTYKKMPQDLILQYQTYSCAATDNLSKAGFNVEEFICPSRGVKAYIKYLNNKEYY